MDRVCIKHHVKESAFKIFIVCVYVCLCVTYTSMGAFRDKKRVLDPSELEFYVNRDCVFVS